MRRMRNRVAGAGLILVLAAALAIAWVGYEPMVMQRMGEERAADQRCLAGVAASDGVLRETPERGTSDAAQLDYAFNVKNATPGPCLVRYEVMFLKEGRSDFFEGGRVVEGGATETIAIPLGRYTRADAEAGKLPSGKELKVWAEAPAAKGQK